MSLQNVHVLHVHQKVTFMVNRYEVFADDNGKPGGQVGFAEQKRLKIKERITIYTDSSKSQVLFEFNARKAIDLGSGYDVTDANGQRIGLFRKDFAKSLLRSTWHLEQPGLPAVTGAERNKWLAGFRRLWQWIPFIGDAPFPMRYHFDFVAENGAPVFSVDKKTWVRDHYLVTVQDPGVDRRLVIAQAVALDALQSR
ncbi:hypothetical protein SK854_46630 [Lentzea sp. BCCO 10_0061]|uniref:Uncharacterized protein n=1 Tax=Lentzea sokolovensis TaxID=3095429 RepID=A0ABU4VD90_9PSEU|nr:hypothetical protein [Lentzea sp. BCCO 10_0061]MDX8149669.1 hypothetical protein [Lentzea sp. BCCO 10_0061]